jgi:hypothetical protein
MLKDTGEGVLRYFSTGDDEGRKGEGENGRMLTGLPTLSGSG